MSKGRLEAFSDGVIAIIITIMVLELKVPSGSDLAALRPLIPLVLSYVLSFVFVGIYWNNHHHLLLAAQRITGPVLWANLHLLFWLSLVPVGTAWMGTSHFALWPVVLYGADLLLCALAYYVLSHALIIHHGAQSVLATAFGRDFKGKVSIAIYGTAIALAFVHPLIAVGLYAIVAVIWLVPDRRIERVLKGGETT
ncbi:MAG: TMEM175 family protein [Reyranellales bacterium]